MLNILGDLFAEAGIGSFRVLVGSKFVDDESESYRYKMLSEIILSMELGESLAMMNLDGIYGCTYDILNQKYTFVANKRHCRVSLGPWSNPMSYVHDNFKCIVIVDYSVVSKLDPPFLNRFEKVMFDNFLSSHLMSLADSLKSWCKKFLTLQSERGLSSPTRDTFVGFCEGTINSLVFKVATSDETATASEILNQCKRYLIQTASCQGMVRSMASLLYDENSDEVNDIFTEYFNDRRVINFPLFIDETFKTMKSEGQISRMILTTFSNFLSFDLENLMPHDLGFPQMSISAISMFNCEVDFSEFIKGFLNDEGKNLMILRFEGTKDSTFLQQAKVTVDNEVSKTACKATKLIIFVIHIDENASEGELVYDTYFSRLWDIAHIDALETTEESWRRIRDMIFEKKNIISYIYDQPNLVDDVICHDSIHGFRSIRYVEKSSARIKDLCAKLSSDVGESLRRLIQKKIMEAMVECHSNQSNWLIAVACDRGELLFSSSSLVVAVNSYVRKLIRNQLIKCVYIFEKYSSFDAYLNGEFPAFADSIFMNSESLRLKDIPIAIGDEFYEVQTSRSGLMFPFSALIVEVVTKELALFKKQEMVLEGDFIQRARFYAKKVMDQFLSSCGIHDPVLQEDFCDDILRITISNLLPNWRDEVLVSVKNIIASHSDRNLSQDAAYLQVFVHSNASLLQAILQVIECGDKRLLSETIDSQEDFLHIVRDLAIRFCDYSLHPVDQTFPISNEHFDIAHLIEWKHEHSTKLPIFRKLLKVAGLDYRRFELTSERHLQDLQFEIMPYAIGIDVIIDFGSLLEEIGIEIISSTIIEIPSFLTADVRTTFSSDMMDYMHRMIEILPEYSTMIVSTMLVMAERVMAVAMAAAVCYGDEDCPRIDQDRLFFDHGIVRVVSDMLEKHAANPVLKVTSIVRSFLVRLENSLFFARVEGKSLTEVYYSLPVHFEPQELDKQTLVLTTDDVASKFDILFSKLLASSLEIQFIDTLSASSVTNYLNDLESQEMADIFLTAVQDIRGNVSSITRRIFAHAIVRCYIEQSAAQLVNNSIPVISLRTLEEALGNHIEDTLISRTLCDFLIKSFSLPLGDAKRACSPGGRLSNQAPWLETVEWDGDAVLTKVNPFLNSSVLEFYDSWNSALNFGDMRNLCGLVHEQGVDALIRLVYLKRCRTETDDVDRQRIQEILRALRSEPTITPSSSIIVEKFMNRFKDLIGNEFSVEHAHILSVIAAVATSKSLQPYFCNVSNIQESFVLCASSNDFAAVQLQGVKLYQCACGYPYSIGECTKPMESIPCRCGRILGGSEHKFHDASTRPIDAIPDDKKGYLYLQDSVLIIDHFERGLSRVAYRVLSLLVHSAAFVGLLQNRQSFEAALQTTPQTLWNFIKESWKILLHQLTIPLHQQDFAAAIVHRILRLLDENNFQVLASTSAKRIEIETQFQEILQPLIQNVFESGRQIVEEMTSENDDSRYRE